MNASTPRQKSPSRSWLSGLRSGGPRRTRHIQPYDRFVKVVELLEAAQTVWTVWQTIDLPGLPTHVKLVQERAPHRTLTVSVSALADRRYYRALGAATPASAHETRAPQTAPETAAPETAAPETAAPETATPATTGPATVLADGSARAETPASTLAAGDDMELPVLSRLFDVAERNFEEARAANLLPFTRSTKERPREPALGEQLHL